MWNAPLELFEDVLTPGRRSRAAAPSTAFQEELSFAIRESEEHRWLRVGATGRQLRSRARRQELGDAIWPPALRRPVYQCFG
jgi:hypothetical protein